MNYERIINFILKQLLCWIPVKSVRRRTRGRCTEALMRILHYQKVRAYVRYRKRRSKARVLVYSAIAGKYDEPQEHTFFNKEWDYRLYTDQDLDNKKEKIYLFNKVGIEIVEGADYNRVAKEYKILPHRFIEGYDYSIWIDGNIKITGPHLSKMFENFLQSKKPLGIFRHSGRNSVSEEINCCLELKKDNPHKITTWKQTLGKEYFPDDQGLFEMSIIMRKHTSVVCQKIMETWWSIIKHNSKRDQLSFTYAVWKNAKKITEVAFINEVPLRTNTDFKFKEHNYK